MEAELQVAHTVQTRDRSTCRDAHRSVAERAPDAAKGDRTVATQWDGRADTEVAYRYAKRAAHARHESASIRTGVGREVAHNLWKADPAATRGAGGGATGQGAAARISGDDEDRTRTQRSVPRALPDRRIRSTGAITQCGTSTETEGGTHTESESGTDSEAGATHGCGDGDRSTTRNSVVAPLTLFQTAFALPDRFALARPRPAYPHDAGTGPRRQRRAHPRCPPGE